MNCDQAGPGGARCWLAPGHPGEHAAVVRWDVDDAPTEKLPPIRDTVRRRPPVPEIRELKGAELLRALAVELERYDEDDTL